ncbi:MAG: leucine-rich repeat domain-containing protein [Clostridia bacterium]|nr:leucine-rich repeat domain-containing protein [Clostridia bacterium]
MKKLLALTLALLLTCAFAFAAAEGGRSTCGDFTYILLPDGTACIADYTGEAAELVIPAELDGVPVTAIGAYAFSACRSLQRVVVPEGVTSLGASAFCSCAGLQSVVLPESLTTIGDIAFCWCTALTEVNIPLGVTEVGANPFYHCRLLVDMGVPEEHPMLAVVDGVLFDRVSMRLITYPETREADHYDVPAGTLAIGDCAFYKCTLTSITIPEGVASIGSEAFAECRGLTAVTLPEGVVSIGEKAFSACRKLEILTLPASLEAIGEDAFTKGPKTLVVVSGSWAESYCIARELPYTLK